MFPGVKGGKKTTGINNPSKAKVHPRAKGNYHLHGFTRVGGKREAARRKW